MAKENFRWKIRSGETFLYNKNGSESQVFEIRMRENVSHHYLFRASRLAFRRFPYFNSRMKVIDGDVFLCSNRNSPTPERRRRLRPLGGSTTLGNLLDITYFKKTIFINFHHAMCDGRGVMHFIRTLLFYYLNLRYPHNNIEIPLARLVGEGMLTGETADPVTDGILDFDKEKVFSIDRTAFALPEVTGGTAAGGDCWRYELTFNLHDVMDTCKRYGCTPAILVSLLMQKGIKTQNPSAEEPILCNLTCDWRDSIGLPNTFRNCVSSIYLPYSEEVASMDMKSAASHFRGLIARQRETDSARKSAYIMKYMSDMLDSLGSYEKKQEVVSGFTSKPINTFVCSNVGRADLGDAEKYIEGIYLYRSGCMGITLSMISVGNVLTITFQQNFPDSLYSDEFLAQAATLGLKPVDCSDAIRFRTPKDHTMNTNPIKSLISFFRRIF